jgi:hypothetical protein
MGAAAVGANPLRHRPEASEQLAPGQAGSIKGPEVVHDDPDVCVLGRMLNFVGWVMRAEAEQLVESIKQSVGLLRRHL